jgi:hypothetical protein
MTTKITEANIEQSTLNTISGGVKITNIVSTDSNYIPLETNVVSTSGGHIKVTGTGFRENSQIHIQSGNTYTLATSVTYTSSTELRSQLPAKSAGSYNVYVTRNDGAFALRINGVTYA